MRRKVVVDFILGAVLVYGLSLAFLYFYQSKLMYFPDKIRPDTETFGVQGVTVAAVETGDGLSLEGWFFPPQHNPGQVIVLFHGNGGHYGHRVFKAAPFVQAGYGVLLAEYRGYGGNPGDPSEVGLYHDARAYIDWLDGQGIKPENIVLYGESLGSGAAVQMATEYDVAGLVLESPFSSAAEVAKSVYFFVPVELLMRDQYKSIDKIGGVKAPALFIHGARDTTIPIRFGRRLYAAANEPKTFIEIQEAGHNDLHEHGAPLHVLEFLRNISQTSAANQKD